MSAMLFINNKYTRTYYSIISNAQNRILSDDVYTETHHIIPKSLGGNNDLDNLVKLTAREHFICHWLLTKMVLSNHLKSMWFALHMMSVVSKNHKQRYSTRITSKVYESTRKAMAHEMRNSKGTPWSELSKAARSEKYKGPGNPNYGKKHTEETKQKIKAARLKQDTSHLKGRIITDEWRQKIRETLLKNGAGKGIAKPTAQCIHCGKTCARHIIARFHDQNCKTAK